ncbi:TIGR04282 family arsenosugar biosynthesis glycosyltransferase [Brumimicrobium mesophilum]|uniref:TIGR04282 family arsenosugar biosynthesis glycosyltransferase n=1 Tax=Brumimicrobium mesophilum TaxID=392717 RepID=UPI000D141A6E|nr:TIGR04282 family arsenosugar biosynthesis glycosyltransferase [Brumimicrobium mesophilum]
MNSNNALIIMTKNPELGKCKTRLAKTLGDEKALEIYIQLIDYTAEISKEIKADKFIYSTDILTDKGRWESSNTFFSIQSQGDLGDRMNNAIQNVLGLGYEKVIVLGSDCAEINADDISNAFEQLSNEDFILGPALDGGYYLIGMKKVSPTLFKEMNWSTETVLEDTITRINDKNSSYSLLESKSDIDFEEDLMREGYVDFQLTIDKS